MSEHPSKSEAVAKRVPLGELIGRQQRVLDCAVAFRDTRAAYIRARVSGARGLDVAAARQRRDNAINALVDAVNDLDGVTSIEVGS